MRWARARARSSVSIWSKSASIGLVGGVLGIVVAALGLLGVRKLYENYDALTRLDFTMGLIALGIAIVSGVLAGLYPTWRVCAVAAGRAFEDSMRDIE